MMKLILEMLSKNTSEMNEQATVNILTTSVLYVFNYWLDYQLSYDYQQV